MSHRWIDSPRPRRARQSPEARPGRREPTRRRVDVEGLESRQLMASEVLAEYPVALPASVPAKIALATDGSLWFSENASRPGPVAGTMVAKVGRVTTAGILTEPASLLPNDSTFGITLGPDNTLWATEQGATPAIAQINPGLDASGQSSSVVEYTNFAPIPGNPTPTHDLQTITRGPQGDTSYVWFTDTGTNAVGRIAVNAGPLQAIQEFPLAANRLIGDNITAGPVGDDGVYFVEGVTFGNQSFIGRIDPNGVITSFPVTNPAGLTPGAPTQLVAGPDDAIYFTEANTNRIGRLDLATGVVNDAFAPIPDVTTQPGQAPSPVSPTAIARFPDGSLIFTESNIGSLGRLTIGPGGTVGTFFQYPAFPSITGPLPGITTDLVGNPWFTEAGTNRIGTFAIPSLPLQAQGVTINGVAGQPLNNIPVATFSDPDGAKPSTEFRAVINWGDGTPNDTVTTLDPAGTAAAFIVRASHTYANAGKYLPIVVITDLASPRSATAFDTATITPVVPIMPGMPGNVTAIAGTPFLGIGPGFQPEPVAVFPAVAGGNYQATVDWGDGTPLGGATITGPTLVNGVPTDSVIATHTFFRPSLTYNGSVTLRNPDGSLTVFPLRSTTTGFSEVPTTALLATAGTPFTPPTDLVGLASAAPNLDGVNGPGPDAFYYSATIDWGDGSPTTTGTVGGPNGAGSNLTIHGSHTFETPGNYLVQYRLADAGATAATGSVVVQVGPLVAPSPGLFLATAGTPIAPLTPLAVLTPASGVAPDPQLYQASIDWGDGSPIAPASLVAGSGGLQLLSSGHTFAAPGRYTATYTVGDAGAPQLVKGTLTIGVGSFTSTPYTLAATAGTPLAPQQLGPFAPVSGIDADPSRYTATVDWGDGTPATPASVVGTPAFLRVQVGGHTYAAPGSYTAAYTVGDAGDPGLFTGTVTVAVSGPTGTPIPTSGVVGRPIGAAAGSLVGQPIPLEAISGLPPLKAGFYSATIDYGDGSPTSTGTLIANPDGSATVRGPSHTYQAAGNFPVTILIGTTGQPNLATFTTSIDVVAPPPAPIAINGQLNPASDSGISNSDAITNVVTPNFFGTTAPGALVQLYARLTANPGGAPILIGSGNADASGHYSINTIPLADGNYIIDALATSADGRAAALAEIESPAHPLVIDTVGPRILGFAVTDTLTGKFQVAYRDERSGLVTPDLVNGANYDVQRPVPTPRPGQSFLVSTLTATPETYPTQPVIVTGSVFNGHYLTIRGGEFIFTINAAGITDVAGNALDGEFFGKFPTGDGHPGGDFKAEVIVRGYTPSAPLPLTTADPSRPGLATVSPTVLAPKLSKPGLNAPPTSLPGVNTGHRIVIAHVATPAGPKGKKAAKGKKP